MSISIRVRNYYLFYVPVPYLTLLHWIHHIDLGGSTAKRFLVENFLRLLTLTKRQSINL